VTITEVKLKAVIRSLTSAAGVARGEADGDFFPLANVAEGVMETNRSVSTDRLMNVFIFGGN